MSAVPLFAVAIYGCGWTAFTDGNEARFDDASACRNSNGFVVMKYAERFGCVGKNGVGYGSPPRLRIVPVFINTKIPRIFD